MPDVAVTPDDGEQVVAFVTLVEFVDADGRRQLGRFTSDGCELWQANGYLHEALHGRLQQQDGKG